MWGTFGRAIIEGGKVALKYGTEATSSVLQYFKRTPQQVAEVAKTTHERDSAKDAIKRGSKIAIDKLAGITEKNWKVAVPVVAVLDIAAGVASTNTKVTDNTRGIEVEIKSTDESMPKFDSVTIYPQHSEIVRELNNMHFPENLKIDSDGILMLPPEYTGSSETEKRYTQYRENRLKISKETADERDNEALAEGRRKGYSQEAKEYSKSQKLPMKYQEAYMEDMETIQRIRMLQNSLKRGGANYYISSMVQTIKDKARNGAIKYGESGGETKIRASGSNSKEVTQTEAISDISTYSVNFIKQNRKIIDALELPIDIRNVLLGKVSPTKEMIMQIQREIGVKDDGDFGKESLDKLTVKYKKDSIKF